VVVLEGAARAGVEESASDGLTVLHAQGSGDDLLVTIAGQAAGQVTLVSADRELRRRAESLGAEVIGPGWLIERIGE
jgi:rRNA-processing protein FCF1